MEMSTIRNVLLLLLELYWAAGLPMQKSFVISTTEPVDYEINTTKMSENNLSVPPKIIEMKVNAKVTNRFCVTRITSKMVNVNSNAQEAVFEVVLPNQAYISGFVMEIDGNMYEAYVQEALDAQKVYNQAKAKGVAAGHVAWSARDAKKFSISVNVEPLNQIVFCLEYEELLERTNDQYPIVINIHPGQPIENIVVEVNIAESRPLKFVRTSKLESISKMSENTRESSDHFHFEVDISRPNSSSATVKFKSAIDKEKEFDGMVRSNGVNNLPCQLVVEYDVERDPYGGEVLVDDSGFFVHFFAPDAYVSTPKHVVFVLDTSGSMEGRRLRQLKDAMHNILGEFRAHDTFNIVEFGPIVKVWDVEKVAVTYEAVEDPSAIMYIQQEANISSNLNYRLPPAHPVTSDYIQNAIKVVEKLEAFGGTDINTALSIGLELSKNRRLGVDKEKQCIILFLTDGEPTIGTTDTDTIIANITEVNQDKIPIFSIAFGEEADRSFLRKLSLRNSAFSRHIYDASDASLQLQEFYKEIYNPSLSHVSFKYTDEANSAKNITKEDFNIFFEGSELVVTGVIERDFIPPSVTCTSNSGPLELRPTMYRAMGNLEHLWAYLTLKQMLEQRDLVKNKEKLMSEALDLALRYSFVTEISSLVVVKPNDTVTVELEDAFLPDNIAETFGGEESTPLVTGLSEAPRKSIHSQAWSTASSISYFEENTTLSKIHKTKLKWISDLMNANGNDTIGMGGAVYKLGTKETASENPRCSNPPTNVTYGYCTLIHECLEVWDEWIPDFETYKRYFCVLDGYAGVCCP